MIYLIPAGLLFLMGWLIRYKKQTWLISGYNIASRKEKEKYDLDKLTRLMGSFLFLLGGVFLLMFFAAILLTGYENEIAWVGFSVESLVIIAGLIYLNTGNRVKKT
ncbi:DUF3784 domain-containing protein [Proteiniclasticum sp. SCR006]|uniref:DUF3784 domain-containing protein n=1 Tax=Proteiniclasticum aestuarii TaxID=2817862 RepID=A0A939HAC8_9CLOT|nr:DUF3784 domain-containing protein [Proteiniclasticum aestuarii]MBO1266106.1 DUF3784 domain-containing protein [Proteiniclasticum aestuarii]